MHEIDLTYEPVIVVRTAEPISVADMEAVAAMGDRLLAAGEPFALVMVGDGGDSKERERGANAVLTKWIKAKRQPMEKLCAGMASVVPTSALLAVYKPMMRVLSKRLYGFPSEMFTDEQAARDWAAGQLATFTT